MESQKHRFKAHNSLFLISKLFAINGQPVPIVVLGRCRLICVNEMSGCGFYVSVKHCLLCCKKFR